MCSDPGVRYTGGVPPEPTTDIEREALRRHLADREVACPGCGYSLRGLTSDRCPECNQLLVLAVRLAEPRLGHWIAGLVALAIGVGFHGLILAWASLVVFSRRGGPPLSDLIPLAVGLGFCGPMLPVWIGQRRRITLWSEPARLAAVLGMWCGSLLPAGWFFATVR